MAVREPGNLLDGKYEILKRLSGGGMSEVYLVRHLHLQENRVVKVLKPEDAADPQAQARFVRAARTATQIKHPNVAILYDFSQLSEGAFYMVWEHVDGEDVGHWIERLGPFPVDIAVELCIQALRGLEAIHSLGVIHRDISPDNLMLMRDARGRIRLKIIDLGLAKSLRQAKKKDLEVTQVGMFMGKLRYCSPEQAGMVEGVELDRRTDLYSLAAVFYEMLSGKPPFESETPHGYVFKRLTEDPLPLVGRVPGVNIPVELDRVVRKALERDREARFSSAVQFIQALDDVQNRLRGMQTRELPRPMLEEVAQRSQTVAPSVSALPPSPSAARPSLPSSSRTSSHLTREERDELLSQIQRASERVERTRGLMSQAEAALASGQLAEARKLIERIESIDLRAKGVADLRARLNALEKPAPDPRTQETEGMLERYLRARQLPLARLAFESLLELDAAHPRRAELERRLAELAQGQELSDKAEHVLAAAREAIAKDDLARAERELAALRRSDDDGTLVAVLEAELERAKNARSESQQVDERRRRFEEHLANGDLRSAERELAALSVLNVSRVTLDMLAGQIAETREEIERGELARGYEDRFREHISLADWLGARELALEMEAALPGHPRPAAMFAEVETRRAEDDRRQAVRHGVQQVELLILRGQAQQAEVALTVLTKLDPKHPLLGELQRKIAVLPR